MIKSPVAVERDGTNPNSEVQSGATEVFGPGCEPGVPLPCPEDITGCSWVVNWAPEAGEASIALNVGGITPDFSAWVLLDDGFEGRVDGNGGLVEIQAIDQVRRERNEARAAARARRELRQFMAAQQLTKMWTLTFANVPPRVVAVRAMNRLMRIWRERRGGTFPYAYVFELGAETGRLHVHLATRAFYEDKQAVQEMWSMGIVQFAERRVARGCGGRERARRLARYLAKYLGKDAGSWHSKGEHRYERAQDYCVRHVRARVRSFAEAHAWLDSQRPGRWVLTWDSEDIVTWSGLPAKGFQEE